MKIGVIAEDRSDVEVMRLITVKIIPDNTFSMAHYVGRGCAKIRSKCEKWVQQLECRGCDRTVVVHDLDEEDEAELRATLEKLARSGASNPWLVLIPVREIEAWLLTDMAAVREGLKLRKEPKAIANPEGIRDPKAKLQEIARRQGKTYVNTIHNPKIAEHVSLQRLQSLNSFAAYPAFVAAAPA